MFHHLCALPTAKGRCDYCGAAVYGDSFRDRLSYREFHITRLCQACQDAVFIAIADDGAGLTQYALRRGAVVASTERDGVLELAFLPFVFTVPDRPPAWEARYFVHAAAVPLPPVDPLDELDVMQRPLRRHQVKVLQVAPFDTPLFTQRFGRCELLVGLDASAFDRVAELCPALAGVARVPLAAPLERRYGASFATLVARYRWDRSHPTPSALRLSAWMGAFLAGPFPSVDPLLPDVLLSCPTLLAQCPPWWMDVEPPPSWIAERPKWRGYVS